MYSNVYFFLSHEESSCQTQTLMERYFDIKKDIDIVGGTRWRSWLRNCATSRKVAGSISDGVTGIFH